MSSVSTIAESTFLNSQIMNIESQLDTISNQVSSGNKSQTFSGINTVSQLSLQLTNEQTMTNGYLTNISNAQTLTSPIQTVLQQITSIANTVRTDALTASSDSLPVTQGSSTLQAEAQAALNQISSLLDTTVGSTYLFSGQATNTAPMPNFGSTSTASSILGQVSALQTSIPLTNSASSGNQLYDSITSFLRNDVVTTTASGAKINSPYGYAGQAATPNLSDYSLTASSAVAVGATTVTVSQSSDLPSVGQYIQFQTVPPQNATYQVQSVSGQTITFTRVPAGLTGADVAVPAGTAISVTNPAAVTTVPAASTTATDATAAGAGGAAAIGATSIQVATISDYKAGDLVSFGAGSTTYYEVTNVNTSTNTITFVPAGASSGGLSAAVTSGTQVNVLDGTPVGSTTINLTSTANVKAGMAVQFSNSSAVYTVTQVLSGTQIQITLQGTTGGVGLQDPLPPSVLGRGTDITAQFGTSAAPLSAEIANGTSLQYGISADNPAFQTIMGALFALATTSLSTTTEAGYRQIATNAAADLQSGSQAVTTLASNLGIQQDTLTTTQTNQQNFVTTLKTQLSNLDDVDMATAISQLTQTQTQLQASFQLLSTMKNLTLANYL